MYPTIAEIHEQVYLPANMTVSDYAAEAESREYEACRFVLDGRRVVCRTAKATPKKVGQFVTAWKRTGRGPIEPLEATDGVDALVVNVRAGQRLGQFVFPWAVLVDEGIASDGGEGGKRGFRLYPPWDHPGSPRAWGTQQWQTRFFYEVGGEGWARVAAGLYASVTVRRSLGDSARARGRDGLG